MMDRYIYSVEMKESSRKIMYWLFCFLFSILSFSLSENIVENNKTITIFPLQFSGVVKITSHLLNYESSEEFPPKIRSMTIYYDYVNKKARADIEAGYEAAKVYIRRYDELKTEYMIRLAPIHDCKRSYLGETMPFPLIPDVLFVGSQYIHGIECDYYLHEDYETRIHIYMSKKDGAPVQLIQESIEDTGLSIPLLTYDYREVKLGPPDASWFEVLEPYDPRECIRHAIGFPYLHIFHYFVKF